MRAYRYFDHVPWVVNYMDYTRLTKLRSTYVGHPATNEEDATGFWQYIHNGKIHPAFHIGRAVTGRSSSTDPNGQNLPKRGRGNMKAAVKAFRPTFIAKPGHVLIEADLSQAELRIAAWMAIDRRMISLYKKGADIHAATAARIMGISIDAFMALPKDVRDMKRFQAKAVSDSEKK
ncbi:DNA polymerase [Aestuariivirga sp.]|uniref:DNA polymerase n=1 Tax=Aestuariivirga sp. TaxID=2650926 RepID=UPI0039E618FC